MTSVTWNASFSVKVASLDEDHKKMFSLINNLHEAMSRGKGAVVVPHLVQELGNYAEHHFAEEESLMERTKYPELVSHRHDHQKFVKQLEQFQQDLAAGRFVSSVPVVVFLDTWLSNHIAGADCKYSQHLNENGIF